MMTRPVDYRFFTALTLAAIAATALSVPARAQRAAEPVACTAPSDLTRFAQPLNRTARRLAAGKPITIVAIGSSSTAGAGASSAAASYPSRLAVELKERFPARTFTMINHGVNGVEVRDILARFEESVAADKPDLVLWQLGTNSLLRDRTLTEAAALINQGLTRLKAIRADVILVNPQYAPKVIAKTEAEHMIKIIATASNQANVNLFDRYAVMKRWRVAENIPFNVFLSPDELHMNDWSYGCIAKLLANAIAEAATRPAQMATSAPARN
jgi:lysophospholipase L1-like esterase